MMLQIYCRNLTAAYPHFTDCLWATFIEHIIPWHTQFFNAWLHTGHQTVNFPHCKKCARGVSWQRAGNIHCALCRLFLMLPLFFQMQNLSLQFFIMKTCWLHIWNLMLLKLLLFNCHFWGIPSLYTVKFWFMVCLLPHLKGVSLLLSDYVFNVRICVSFNCSSSVCALRRLV